MLNGKLVSASVVPYADTLGPIPPCPMPPSPAHSECLKLNPAFLPTPSLLQRHPLSQWVRPPFAVTQAGDLTCLQPFCCLSLQLVSHQVRPMSPSPEISPLPPMPHDIPGLLLQPPDCTPPSVSPSFGQPSTSVVLSVVPRPRAPASPGNLLALHSEQLNLQL